MIKEYTLTINKRKSLLNKNLVISTQDKGIDIRFNIMDCDYMNLNSRNLYSQIYIKSPKNVQIESEVCPIINNTVIFTLTNDIMNKVTEEGIYELYIVIIDDKRNTNVLPVINMTVEQSRFTMKDIADGVVDESVIDYARVTSVGNAIKTFNIDKTYNATNHNKGDLITEAKLNKIEECLTVLRDDSLDIQDTIKDIKNNQFKNLVGEESNPIVISNLSKGLYVIKGYVTNFVGSEKKYLNNEGYYFVSYSDDKTSRIIKSENEDENFLICRYDKVLGTIYLSQEEMFNLKIENEYIGVKTYKNQKIELTEDAEILLPEVDDYVEMNLFIYTTNNTNLKFPTDIYWSSYRNLEENKAYKVSLKYIDGSWLGSMRLFDKNETEEIITRAKLTTDNNEVKLKEANCQELKITRDTTVILPTNLTNKKIILYIDVTLRDILLTFKYTSDNENGEMTFKLKQNSNNVFNIDCNQTAFLITKKSDYLPDLSNDEKESGIKI